MNYFTAIIELIVTGGSCINMSYRRKCQINKVQPVVHAKPKRK